YSIIILNIIEEFYMFITFIQLKDLIDAYAFLLLVIYLCRVLARLTSTVSELTKSIKTLTEDADDISEKIEDLLVKTNSLMDDVNQKSSKLDPLLDRKSDV